MDLLQARENLSAVLEPCFQLPTLAMHAQATVPEYACSRCEHTFHYRLVLAVENLSVNHPSPDASRCFCIL